MGNQRLDQQGIVVPTSKRWNSSTQLVRKLSTKQNFCSFFRNDQTFAIYQMSHQKNAAEVKALVGDKFGKRVIFTAKKMGAQTLEANNNAGVAAANQIVGFFERGETRFQVKA